MEQAGDWTWLAADRDHHNIEHHFLLNETYVQQTQQPRLRDRDIFYHRLTNPADWRLAF